MGKYGIKQNTVIIRSGELQRVLHGVGKISGRIYVSAGVDEPGTPMSVFIEMGTGPQGRDHMSGPNGKRYPLPPSAYTQEPWTYRAADGTFHVTDGMKPNPYLYPAVMVMKPFAEKTITDAIKESVSSGGTVRDGIIDGFTKFMNLIKAQAKLFCTDPVRRNAIVTEIKLSGE